HAAAKPGEQFAARCRTERDGCKRNAGYGVRPTGEGSASDVDAAADPTTSSLRTATIPGSRRANPSASCRSASVATLPRSTAVVPSRLASTGPSFVKPGTLAIPFCSLVSGALGAIAG